MKKKNSKGTHKRQSPKEAIEVVYGGGGIKGFGHVGLLRAIERPPAIVEAARMKQVVRRRASSLNLRASKSQNRAVQLAQFPQAANSP